MLTLTAIRMQPSECDSQKPLTRSLSQRQPNLNLHSFNAIAMSASAQVINNADVLAHIASFMHFSSDPEQEAADDGYRLALLPSRSMLPSSRAKIMGVVSEWTTEQMRLYLIRRTAYIQRQQHERPAGSEMPIDLPVVAGQLNAWLDRHSDELRGLRSRVQNFKLTQIMHLVEALQREYSRWDTLGDPLFSPGIRDRIIAIANAQRLNIQADAMRREKAQFDSKSKALLEIIAAKLMDQPAELQRTCLGFMREKFEALRAEAAKDYQLDDARVTNEQRLNFYQLSNDRLKLLSNWLSGPCDHGSSAFKVIMGWF